MSTAKFSTWLNPNGTENYKCRAWVNFNGTGTVAIRAAGNVASITDNGTGDYTVNFTNAMVDANYATVAIPGLGNGNATAGQSRDTENRVQTTAATSIFVGNANNGTAIDVPYIAVAIFR
jgi:hypothetical protein